jgi:hypothetical protein
MYLFGKLGKPSSMSATGVIPFGGYNQHNIVQIHRQDNAIKQSRQWSDAAAKELVPHECERHESPRVARR